MHFFLFTHNTLKTLSGFSQIMEDAADHSFFLCSISQRSFLYFGQECIANYSLIKLHSCNALQRYNISLMQYALIRTYGDLLRLSNPFQRFRSSETLLLIIGSSASTHQKRCKQWVDKNHIIRPRKL